MRNRAVAVLAALLAAASARAIDPLEEALRPLDPSAPVKLGIGQPNGPAHARKAKAELEPYLSRVMGRPVSVEILADYEGLTAALAGGTVDVAWTTPLAFVLAQRRNGEVAAVAKAMRAGKLFYRAALVVRADSPARSLADVKGKRVAWVSRGSSSGYLFPRALLAAKGEDPDRFFSAESFAGDHPGACEAVRSGTADVCATFANERSGGEPLQADGCADAPPASDFRIIAAGGPVPNDVIAARPGLDERLLPPVLAAFAGMARDQEGRRVLREVFHADGWGVAVEGDFESVVKALPPAKAPPGGTRP